VPTDSRLPRALVLLSFAASAGCAPAVASYPTAAVPVLLSRVDRVRTSLPSATAAGTSPTPFTARATVVDGKHGIHASPAGGLALNLQDEAKVEGGGAREIRVEGADARSFAFYALFGAESDAEITLRGESRVVVR
jgi:hypothetical protein